MPRSLIFWGVFLLGAHGALGSKQLLRYQEIKEEEEV